MPKVTVTVPHTQDPDAVVEKARPAIEKTVADFQGQDLAIEWTGRSANFSFKSLAFTIKGHTEVQDQQVLVEIDLPFAAMMFKDKVERAVTKNLTRSLEAKVDE